MAAKMSKLLLLGLIVVIVLVGLTLFLDFRSANSIRVRVSGDQYKGAPEFMIVVDGQAVGRPMPVNAVHHKGRWQTISVPRPRDDPKEVRIVFGNDLYGGSSDQDRNLFVDWIEVNGHRYTAALARNEASGGYASADPHAATLYVNGPIIFRMSGR